MWASGAQTSGYQIEGRNESRLTSSTLVEVDKNGLARKVTVALMLLLAWEVFMCDDI